MKKLNKELILNKKSIQILDDKTLVDLKGGANEANEVTCNEGSCNADSCWYWSCKKD